MSTRHNKGTMVAEIKNLIRRNYDVDPMKIDVHSHVDKSLTFRENWNKIKPQVLRLSQKSRRLRS